MNLQIVCTHDMSLQMICTHDMNLQMVYTYDMNLQMVYTHDMNLQMVGTHGLCVYIYIDSDAWSKMFEIDCLFMWIEAHLVERIGERGGSCEKVSVFIIFWVVHRSSYSTH